MPTRKIRYAVTAVLCALVTTSACATAIAAEDTARGNELRRIKFYRNPMGLPDVSPTPKQDSMGMDYIPVYEDEDADDGTIKISPGKIQKTGVRSEQVARRVLNIPLRVPATIQPDERRTSVVAFRFEGFMSPSRTSPQASTSARASP